MTHMGSYSRRVMLRPQVAAVIAIERREALTARSTVAIGALLATMLLAAACGGGPTSPSSSRLQVSFSSQAPDRCGGPCMRLAWIDQGSTSQGLLKIAVQVQNIP